MKKIKVVRENWLRGDQEISRARLNRDDDCCIMGHVISQALDIDPELFENAGFPDDWANVSAEDKDVRMLVRLDIVRHDQEAEENYPGEPRYYMNTAWVERAISINDREEISEREREERLIDLFADHGFELEFVDGPLPRFLS